LREVRNKFLKLLEMSFRLWRANGFWCTKSQSRNIKRSPPALTAKLKIQKEAFICNRFKTKISVRHRTECTSDSIPSACKCTNCTLHFKNYSVTHYTTPHLGKVAQTYSVAYLDPMASTQNKLHILSDAMNKARSWGGILTTLNGNSPKCLLFCMGVKLGLSRCRRYKGRRCSRIGYWEGYFDLTGTRWQWSGEDYITRNFMICTNHQI
jgi:hypothetical protein